MIISRAITTHLAYTAYAAVLNAHNQPQPAWEDLPSDQKEQFIAQANYQIFNTLGDLPPVTYDPAQDAADVQALATLVFRSIIEEMRG